MTDTAPVLASGTFAIGGDLPVHRLGYGAMRITGEGAGAHPPTATSPSRSCAAPSSSASTSSTPRTPTARTSARTSSARRCTRTRRPGHRDQGRLHPPGPGRVDARRPPGVPAPVRRDDACGASGVERIDLYQLHRIDPRVPLEDQLGELAELAGRGQDPAHRAVRGRRRRARDGAADRRRSSASRTSTTSSNRRAEASSTLRPSTASRSSRGSRSRPGGLAGAGRPARADRRRAHGATPAQLALAWLLRRSPVMLPIPGTGVGGAPRGELLGRAASS